MAVVGEDGGAVTADAGAVQGVPPSDPCGCGTNDAGAPLCEQVSSCGSQVAGNGEIGCKGPYACVVQAIPGGPADPCVTGDPSVTDLWPSGSCRAVAQIGVGNPCGLDDAGRWSSYSVNGHACCCF